jgi:pyrophosphatase PpaX
MDEVFEEFKLHENLIDALIWLRKKGVRMAIVSFALSGKIKSHLKRLKIDRYFDFVLGPNDVTHPKPHPEIIEKTMKKLGAKPDETLLIGDAEMDIETGKNAGVLTALYTPQTNKKYIDTEAYQKLDADFRFEHFSQLPSKVSFLL